MTDFLIKSTIAMEVLLALYHFLFEREKMHRFNRFYLISGLVFSLMLPLIAIPLYVEAEAEPQPMVMEQQLEFREQQMPGATPKDEVSQQIIKAVEAIEEPKINYWPYIGWGFYLVVATILAVRFVLNILQFFRLKRNNQNINYRGTNLVLLDYDALPHTFLRTIYMSTGDYKNRDGMPELFTHELAHVNQLHTLDILFIETLKTIFWFNPLLYFYKKAIQLNHEFLADEKVINTTANTVYYQQLLLEKASVGKTFSLASNLNFSLTKKRFIMMTKTTNQTKSVLLKFAVLPAAVGLLYFLSTETVVLAKTKDFTPPAVDLQPQITTSTFEIAPETSQDSTKQETPVKSPAKGNSVDTETRKNEYYKGVRIIIEDAKKGKYIDLPYEHLTAEDRQYYLPEAPEKRKGKGISDADYDYAINKGFNESGCTYYLDDHKVSRDEILKYKKEDFASYAAKSTGMQLIDGKLKGNNFSYFYTRDYFDKYLKHSYDHYPDSSLKITITEKPGDVWLGMDKTPEQKLSGKTDLDLDNEKNKKELEADYYPTVEEIKKIQRSFYPRFPDGNDKFAEYLTANVKGIENFKDKELTIHFTVNTDGSLTDAWIPGEKEGDFIENVKRVIKNAPTWIPSQQNNKPYKVGFSFSYPPKPSK